MGDTHQGVLHALAYQAVHALTVKNDVEASRYFVKKMIAEAKQIHPKPEKEQKSA